MGVIGVPVGEPERAKTETAPAGADESGPRLIRIIRNELSHTSWSAEEPPLAQLAEPDLVLKGPDNQLVVIELLLGSGDVHVASLAQADTVAGVLQRGEGVVTPVILTTRSVPEGIERAAEQIGVKIIADADKEQLPSRLVQFLVAPRS
jgi:hypothetical protein